MTPGLAVLLAVVVGLLASSVATLNLSLHMFSPSALERRLTAQGRAGVGVWLSDRLHDAGLSVALLRTALHLAFTLLVLVALVGMGDAVELNWGALLITLAIALAVLWVFSTVVARAMAYYLPESIVMFSLPVLRGLTLVLMPVTRSVRFVDEVVRRLCGIDASDLDEVIEQKLLQRIEDTHLQGGIDEDAAEMLENLVEFRSTDVGEVMTPRTDIEGLQLTHELEEVREFIKEAGHSRIPVYGENLDDIKGILYVKDLIPFLGKDAGSFDMRTLLRNPIRVPETKPVHQLLQQFQQAEVHMAIVVDEYGGTAGLATIEDVLEEIVGEIHDEHDTAEEEPPALVPIDDMVAEVDARFHIDDFNEAMELELPEDEEYDTIGGYVLAQLGHVPVKGERFEAHGAVFTTLEAAPTHIDKIRIERLEARPSMRNGNGNGNGNGHGGGKDRDARDRAAGRAASTDGRAADAEREAHLPDVPASGTSPASPFPARNETDARQ